MNVSVVRAQAYPQIQFIITLIIISFSSGFDSATDWLTPATRIFCVWFFMSVLISLYSKNGCGLFYNILRYTIIKNIAQPRIFHG